MIQEFLWNIDNAQNSLWYLECSLFSVSISDHNRVGIILEERVLVWCQAVLSYSFSVLKFIVVLDMELLLGCNLFNITYLLRSHPGKIGLDCPGYDPYALFQVLNFKMWVDCIIINMS